MTQYAQATGAPVGQCPLLVLGQSPIVEGDPAALIDDKHMQLGPLDLDVTKLLKPMTVQALVGEGFSCDFPLALFDRSWLTLWSSLFLTGHGREAYGGSLSAT